MNNENTPTGWTDNMAIKLVGDIDLESLINQILARFQNYEDYDTIYNELIVPNVAEYDRNIVLDRAIGGIVRALTGIKSNRPDKVKDPIAYKTFEVVWGSFKSVGFIITWKRVGGFWKEWNEWRCNKW